ncbi:MAG: hypothetical protein IJI75_03290 [Solobacterium sp.]|nr:hypothetical protein [Solobacterium sp.]
MIITEVKDGFVHTYSDTGYRLIQDGTGLVYDEAYDPEDQHRTYQESSEKRTDQSDEASTRDLYAALKDLGVIDNEQS